MKILPVILSLSLFASVSVHAGTDGRLSHESSLDRLNVLKQQISRLLAENSQLEVEYSLLHQEFLDVQREYHAHGAQLQDLRRMDEKQKQLTAEREQQYRAMQQNLPDAESEELLVKSQIALLKQQLLDEEDAMRLITLKIADKEREMRQLTLQNKSSEFGKRIETADQSVLLEDLKQLYEKNLEREQETLRLMERAEDEGQQYGVTMERLQSEIRGLQEQVKQLDARKSFRQQEQSLLRNKRLYEVRLTENQIWQNEQLKLSLEKQVDQLETEYQRLNGQVAASLEQQTRQRQVLDQIIEIDSENQRLKDMILDLEPQVKALQ